MPLTGALSSSIQQGTDFVSTTIVPTIYVYILTNNLASPAIVVVIHKCGGTVIAYATNENR